MIYPYWTLTFPFWSLKDYSDSYSSISLKFLKDLSFIYYSMEERSSFSDNKSKYLKYLINTL